MPLLALSKQWFNPYLGFLIRLFVRLSLVIPGYTVQILLIKAAAQRASLLTGRAYCFGVARVAGRRISSSVLRLIHIVVALPRQERAVRTGVLVDFSIVAELIAAKERCALIPIGEWHIGANTSIFQHTYDFDVP
jgi:hypothetical protein